MQPDWLDTAVFYQIYPQSFADANGDGIGDLAGLISKLDYIAELGANALWINPIFDSPFLDAGYDVRNYFEVAPRYGSNADVRELCAAAHARGIRVCLDLVAGHTASDHPGFVASCEATANPWSDRFVWTDNPWSTREGDINFISGTSDRMGSYGVNFFAHQPALNYGFANRSRVWQQSPEDPGPRANRAMLRDIMAFWFEHGVDGFRVDLAATLVKRDPTQTGVRALWRELRAWLDAEHPDKVLISEWGDPARAVSAGFHVDFMLHFGTPGFPELMFNGAGSSKIRTGVTHCWFDALGRGDVNHFIESFMQQSEQIGGRGLVGLPSANHDFQRPRVGGRSVEELVPIFAFLMTWPAVPFIYYGDEIGMRFIEDMQSREGAYQRTGTRTPMQWSAGPGAGFSTAAEDDFYLPLDPAADRPDVESARADADSLWHQVRRLTTLRRREPALAGSADLARLDSGPGYPLVLVRGAGADRLLIAIDPSRSASDFTLPPDLVLGEPLYLRGARSDAAGIHLDGLAVGIWRIAP